MLPNVSFQRFLTEIEPSRSTTDACSAAYRRVRRHLEGHEFYGWHISSIFLAGSYARKTAIRPRIIAGIKDTPDVDIMVVTDHPKKDHPDDVLEELSATLSEEFDVKRTNRRSVRLETSKCLIDVVPVVNVRNRFRLPDRDEENWIYTNPPYHTLWSTERNSDFDGRFKPLVKMFKWWRRENITSKRPKGFALEVLVAKHAPESERHFGEAFCQMLETICDKYYAASTRGEIPVIADPALQENDLLSRVSPWQWQKFMEKAKTHAAVSRRAQRMMGAEAFSLWRRILGERFFG